MKNSDAEEPRPFWMISDPEQIAKMVATLVQKELLGPDSGSNQDRLLNVAEAADYLRCSDRRVYDLHRLGDLRFVKDGNRLLTRPSWIESYLGSYA